jgi:hypothetical protein
VSTRKLVPLGGIAFVVLVVATVVGIGGSTPDSHAAAAEVASFYDEHAVRQGIGAFVLAASVPFLVFFGIGLLAALDARGSAWGRVLMAGNILTAAGVLTTAFIHFALVDGGDSGISPTALQALNVLDGNTWMAFNAGLGVMMLGAAGAMLSGGVLRWLGWTALVLGLVLFIPFADFFALLVSLLWIVVAGIAIAGDGERATQESRATVRTAPS